MLAAWKKVLVSALLVTTWLGPGPIGVHAIEGPPRKGTVQPSARLLITGSSTMAPMMAEIGKRFRTLHPGVQVDVQTSAWRCAR